MNPKEMTNEQLAEYPRDFTSQDLLSATVEDIQNQPFSSRCKAECDELLRRLNEADALRKENAELLSLLNKCYKTTHNRCDSPESYDEFLDATSLIGGWLRNHRKTNEGEARG